MRGVVALIFLALMACQQEPSFDERFETAQDEIEEKAKELEKELDEPSGQADETAKDAEAPET